MKCVFISSLKSTHKHFNVLMPPTFAAGIDFEHFLLP